MPSQRAQLQTCRAQIIPTSIPHQSVSLIGLSQLDLITEFNALQSRCAVLKAALAQSPSSSSQCNPGHTIAPSSQLDLDVGSSASCERNGLTNLAPVEYQYFNSFTSLEVYPKSDVALHPLDQRLLPFSGIAAPTLQPSSKEARMQDNNILDSIPGVDTKSEFQDLFDFNLASGPDGFYSVTESTKITVNGISEVLDDSSLTQMSMSLSLPSSAQPTAATALAHTRARHHCRHCAKTFSRSSDRDRHALKHDPTARRFPCSFPGCRYVGRQGFLRKDKLTQHQTHMRH